MDPCLQRLTAALASATQGMTIEDLNRHPEGKWCAAEVLEHLSLTYTSTTKGFDRCLAQGAPMARKPAINDRVRTLVVVGLGHLPEGREAPANTRPKGQLAEKVVADVAAKIEDMDSAIARCEERFGTRTRLIDHPILGPLTGPQWRKFHWVHGRHHIKQILRLKKAPR